MGYKRNVIILGIFFIAAAGARPAYSLRPLSVKEKNIDPVQAHLEELAAQKTKILVGMPVMGATIFLGDTPMVLSAEGLTDPNGKIYPLRPGRNIIGRESGIDDNFDTVSRIHAELDLSADGRIILYDLSSTYGTQIGYSSVGEVAFADSNATVVFGGQKGVEMVFARKDGELFLKPAVMQGPAVVKFKLKPGVNMIGSAPGNTVVLKDTDLSAKHAIVFLAPDMSRAVIYSCGKNTGTILRFMPLGTPPIAPLTPTVVRKGPTVKAAAAPKVPTVVRPPALSPTVVRRPGVVANVAPAVPHLVPRLAPRVIESP
ncbi:MAG: FHA domain-containing protein, partial [Candidatus Omnitrophica bacterium]|nr:FHA domain-containing protein [Candidatus Omnitrophota bacterium]